MKMKIVVMLAACVACAFVGQAEPEAWIVRGDRIDRSSSGGEIRLYGRSLENVELMYFSKTFGFQVLPKKAGSAWQASFAVPLRIRACDGDVRIRTAGEEKWTVCRKWRVEDPSDGETDRIFDVTAFGAIPNDRKDDTVAFSNALAAAGRAGGGTVRVPCGRFLLSDTIAVPAKTRLCGVSKEKSCVYWNDAMDLPADFITLREGSGISGLLISSGQYRGGIAAYDASGRPGHVSDITLEDLTIRFLSDTQREPGRRNGKMFMARYRMPGAAVSIPDSTRIKLCRVDLYSDKDPVASDHLIVSGSDIEVTDSRLMGTGCVRIDGENIVFDRNEGYATAFYLGAHCRNLYFGRSYVHRRLAGEREALALIAAKDADRSRILVVGNAFEDVGLVRFDGKASGLIVAENVCTRAGGLIACGACNDVLFLANRIIDGNCLRGPFDREQPEDAVIGAVAVPGAAVCRGVVLRGNRIDGNGYVDVRGATDAVIEGNAVANADRGIVGDAKEQQVTLGHNEFLNVDCPYVGLDRAKRDRAPRKKRLLIVSQALGYAHQMALVVGTEKIAEAGRASGAFEVTVATVEALGSPADVAGFDAIVLNNTTALECEKIPGLAETLTGFVSGGKGIAFVHAAVDAFYGSPEMQALSGGLFSGHPWHYEGTWRFRNELPDDPLNASFEGAKTFGASDEIYQQKSPPFDRKNCKVLVSLVADDPANRKAEEAWRNHSLARVRRDFPVRADRDFAVSWTKEYGKGRVFHTSFGHDERAFLDPARFGHILAGIRYALGLQDAER